MQYFRHGASRLREPKRHLTSQLSLFDQGFDTFCADTGVPRDRIGDYFRSGLLSFDPLTTPTFGEGEHAEVMFVDSVCRSELERATAESLLLKVEPPRSLDPLLTAYCFGTKTWVRAAERTTAEERREEFLAYIDQVAEEGSLSVLEDLQWHLLQRIEDMQSQD